MQQNRPFNKTVHSTKPYIQQNRTCNKTVHSTNRPFNKTVHSTKPYIQQNRPFNKTTHSTKPSMQRSFSTVHDSMYSIFCQISNSLNHSIQIFVCDGVDSREPSNKIL